jgi:hypothetical protein
MTVAMVVVVPMTVAGMVVSVTLPMLMTSASGRRPIRRSGGPVGRLATPVVGTVAMVMACMPMLSHGAELTRR